MSKPQVSFVIPVYKKDPEVFRHCLESLFDQSLKDIEVICVFDGADADLEEVANSYQDILKKYPVTHTKQYLESEPVVVREYRDNSRLEDRSELIKVIVIDHGGAPKARNAGLRLATGDYVVFWDADCYIKPEAANRWLQEFEAKPDVDFVYTGYELAGERGGHEGEPFDYYSLTCGNYICSMSPIKRDKAFLWDETLTGAQDWDYFLTACEKGLKGAWIPGSAFITDAAGPGISSGAWSAENRKETIRKIREKHGIPDRKIGVCAHENYERGLKLAKILDADFIKPSGKSFEDYEIVFVYDYGWASRFDGVPKEVVKIQYWTPGWIEALLGARYESVIETVKVSKNVINICATDYEKNKLANVGITAEVVPLPLSKEDLEKPSSSLPEKFKILLITDQAYGKLLQEIPQDLPHIEFVFNQGSIKECSCVMSFYRFAALDDAILIAQVNGRNVISNVQAPYCGFVDPDAEYEDFKKALYEKVREVRTSPFNKEAQDYYKEYADPRKFAEAIRARAPKVLEVVA